MIKEKYKKGFLMEVENSKGKKKDVYLAQGRDDGWTARYFDSGKKIGSSTMKAERFARKLAKKGHKKVMFLD